MPQPTLHTGRITLVPLADEHLEHEVDLDSRPEVMRFLTGRPRTRAEVEELHPRRLAIPANAPGLGFWSGFTSNGSAGEFVGWWILEPPEREDQRTPGQAELGYRLLPRFWRQGLAGERPGADPVRLRAARPAADHRRDDGCQRGVPRDDAVGRPALRAHLPPRCRRPVAGH